ncbi:hypothetical protein [Parasitella parasitica]|uniref:Uncharacterized protein n=1 Tax=Parasitella parasitica TaxID=35722 RepID=A0A0B7NS46_9FUNG|nr:hypothetical protein [Parasitella parasitica]
MVPSEGFSNHQTHGRFRAQYGINERPASFWVFELYDSCLAVALARHQQLHMAAHLLQSCNLCGFLHRQQ